MFLFHILNQSKIVIFCRQNNYITNENPHKLEKKQKSIETALTPKTMFFKIF